MWVKRHKDDDIQETKRVEETFLNDDDEVAIKESDGKNLLMFESTSQR